MPSLAGVQQQDAPQVGHAPGSPMTTRLSALQRAAELLAARLERLEARLSGDDDAVWREYRETVTALASVLAQMTPGRNGGLLTTAQMAERLHVTPKTLLKR